MFTLKPSILKKITVSNSIAIVIILAKLMVTG